MTISFLREKRRRFWKRFIELLALFSFLLFVRTYIAGPYKIPTGSMVPTLLAGDFIFVSKVSYGLKIPFTRNYLFGPSSPKRGDVVVFRFPEDHSMVLVKRLVAIPGDTIEIKRKKIYLNGKKISEKRIKSKFFERENRRFFGPFHFDLYLAELGEKSFFYQLSRENFSKSRMKEKKLAENEYFVLGDNRDFSNDSRYWGTIKQEDIIGKALVIWLSLSYPSGDKEEDAKRNLFRWNRFGKSL